MDFDTIDTTLSAGARHFLISFAVILIVAGITVGALIGTGVIKLPGNKEETECKDKGDCKAGQLCTDGKCVTGCELNNNCNAGQICYKGQCSTPPKDECAQASDCPQAQTCSDSKCVPKPCGDGCDLGYKCIGDQCIPDNPDCTATACDRGYYCDGSECVPEPEEECVGEQGTDSCTSKGPKFFCNELNQCVETKDDPPVPAPASGTTRKLRPAQIAAIAVGSILAIPSLLFMSRWVYNFRSKLNPRESKRSTGLLVAAVLTLLAIVLTGALIGTDQSDVWLIFPLILVFLGMFMAAGFEWQRYSQAKYTNEEATERVFGDVIKRSKKDLDAFNEILEKKPEAVKPKEILRAVKQAAYVQTILGSKLKYQTPLNEEENKAEIASASILDTVAQRKFPIKEYEFKVLQAYNMGLAYGYAKSTAIQTGKATQELLDRFKRKMNDASIKPDKITELVETIEDREGREGTRQKDQAKEDLDAIIAKAGGGKGFLSSLGDKESQKATRRKLQDEKELDMIEAYIKAIKTGNVFDQLSIEKELTGLKTKAGRKQANELIKESIKKSPEEDVRRELRKIKRGVKKEARKRKSTGGRAKFMRRRGGRGRALSDPFPTS